jgi:hypothetical protein
MKLLIPTCAIALALGVAAHAQDSTVTSKTKVEADDARTVVAKGCLLQAPGTSTFTLRGAVAATGEDLESKSRVRTDVDKDDTTVKAETSTKVDRDDRAVGTSGTMKIFELSPRAGVDLAAHAGKEVEISAVMIDAANGDDDAEIEIEEKRKAEVDDAPDAKSKTETELEIPRGQNAKLTVVSVTSTGAACSN